MLRRYRLRFAYEKKKCSVSIDTLHVITAERLRDGRMIFYDAQSGEFLNFKEYLDRDIEYLEILKVDKLLLREDIFKSIARVL